jgi:flagellar biosynthesis activator protein FlaF
MENQETTLMEMSAEGRPKPGNPTFTEAWALVESAKRMAAPLEFAPLEQPENRKKLREALRLNWRLWTIFQAEMTVGENDNLPKEMRENFLNLCNFVDKQTIDTLNIPTAEKVAALIDINCNIANGLLATAA